jgi:hypothetical protein
VPNRSNRLTEASKSAWTASQSGDSSAASTTARVDGWKTQARRHHAPSPVSVESRYPLALVPPSLRRARSTFPRRIAACFGLRHVRHLLSRQSRQKGLASSLGITKVRREESLPHWAHYPLQAQPNAGARGRAQASIRSALVLIPMRLAPNTEGSSAIGSRQPISERRWNPRPLILDSATNGDFRPGDGELGQDWSAWRAETLMLTRSLARSYRDSSYRLPFRVQ